MLVIKSVIAFQKEKAGPIAERSRSSDLVIENISMYLPVGKIIPSLALFYHFFNQITYFKPLKRV